VAQIILKPIQNRVNNTSSDSLGQWAWQELRLDGTRSLVVITAYQPCKEPTNSTHTTTWHQQYQGLWKRGIQDPDPCSQFFTDLKKFINKQHQDGNLIILGMEANLAYNIDEVLDFLMEADLVDLFL